MENTPAEQGVEELALMLMYLCRMSENIPGLDRPIYHSWKNYEWATVDKLENDGMLSQSRKMIHLTEDGLDRARELLVKYGIEDWAPIPEKKG